ncbi:MAG: class D sortase [Coriobacteriales bacterium]|nr:class D sortase [Coriobacteriales bacterium]
MKSFSKTPKLLAYLGVPAVFCVLGYALLWLALQPVWPMASATVGLLVSDEAPNFDAGLTTVYDPNAFKAEVKEDGFISGADVHFPEAGEQYGKITCERIGLDAPVYWYDSDEILAYGVGQSLISFPPGYGREIILSGHNTTYFACLEDVGAGDIIKFDTNYCNYEYKVTRVQVYDENELEHLLNGNMFEEKEELIMYTCYPFYAISGRKTDRLTVFATRISGLDVKWRGVD